MIREKDSSKLIGQLLIVLLAISILMMAFVFINPKPALASEETPPPPTDSISFGCVCFEGPLTYRCCSNFVYIPETGRYICTGNWYYISYVPYWCDYWSSYP